MCVLVCGGGALLCTRVCVRVVDAIAVVWRCRIVRWGVVVDIGDGVGVVVVCGVWCIGSYVGVCAVCVDSWCGCVCGWCYLYALSAGRGLVPLSPRQQQMHTDGQTRGGTQPTMTAGVPTPQLGDCWSPL